VGHPLSFPQMNCDFLGIAFAMPTCWDETKGVGLLDPFGHVAYTVDGTVSGACPANYNKRIPQVQLFVRVSPYRGADFRYELSDNSNAFHVDFMNGWQEGKLAEIIRDCAPSGETGYNPPCDCTQFLTQTPQPSGRVCDSDVKQYILNESTDSASELPRGTCQQTALIDKSWDVDPPFQCIIAPPVVPPDSDDGNEPPSNDPPSNDPPSDDPPSNDPPSDESPDDPPSGECKDSLLEFKMGKKTRDCEWVAQNTNKRCRKGMVKSQCPVTCNAPSFCDENSRAKFFVEEIDKFRKCNWVKKDPQNRCQMMEVCNSCRATCKDFELCTDFED